MKRHNDFLFLILVSLTAAAMVGCSDSVASSPGEKQPPVDDTVTVDTIVVRPEKIQSSLELVGTLIPVQTTVIASEIDGVVDYFPSPDDSGTDSETGKGKSGSIGLSIGDEVRKGDPLVFLRTVDVDLALKASMAKLTMVEKEMANLLAWRRVEEIAQLEAQLAEVTASFTRCHADLQRSQQLFRQGARTQSEHDEAIMSYKMAEATVRKVQATLDMAKKGPTAEEIEVAKASLEVARAEVAVRQETAKKAVISAPYDAVITERYVDPGELLMKMPRVDIMKIADINNLFAEVDVPERYQSLVHKNDQAYVMATGIKQRLSGHVSMINGMIDRQTRTFRVRIAIDNHRRIFKPGGHVQVELPIHSSENVVVVPVGAVVFKEGAPNVFVIDKGVAHLRPIKPGISSRTHYAVTSGLQSGEVIALTQTALLNEGLPVKARQATITPSPIAVPENHYPVATQVQETQQ